MALFYNITFSQKSKFLVISVFLQTLAPSKIVTQLKLEVTCKINVKTVLNRKYGITYRHFLCKGFLQLPTLFASYKGVYSNNSRVVRIKKEKKNHKKGSFSFMLNIFITENVSRDAAVMLYVLVSFSCQNQPWSSVGQLSSEECRLCRRRC